MELNLITEPITEPITELAPAKINLALHVLGQSSDGYHSLDMLIGFADICDKLTLLARPIENQRDIEIELSCNGPFGHHVPRDESNLIHKAVRAFHNRFKNLAKNISYRIILEKNLPLASGIGGGSADATATLRALAKIHQLNEQKNLLEVAAQLGADCPMCLLNQSCRARGKGDEMTPYEIPKLPILLINPNEAVSTPQIFSQLRQKENPPLPSLASLSPVAKIERNAQFFKLLAKMRNDLTAPAQKISPIIGTLLKTLNQANGAKHVAMSGSGATCYALFEDPSAAQNCFKQLKETYPNWWTALGTLL